MVTLYEWRGTAEMTTSEMRRQSWRVNGVGEMTWWGLYLEVADEDGGGGEEGSKGDVEEGVEGRLENSTMASGVNEA